MPEAAVKKEKLWSRDFVLIMIASSGIAFCNYFFSSTLPIYAENLTGTKIYAGLMMTVFTIAALATRPVAGVLSDKYGRVKLLILGAALCAVACLLYNFAWTIVLLLIMRFLHGAGFGVHSTSGGAIAGDIIPKSRLSEGLGIYSLYATFASAVAPGIALSLIGEGSTDGFRTLFIIAAVVASVCIVMDSLIRYERRKTAQSGVNPAEPQEYLDAPLPKTFLGFEYGVFLPAALIILLFIAFSTVMSFLTLFAKDREMGNIGLYFTLSAVGMFLSRAFLGRITDRRGSDIIVIPALAALIVFYAVLPLIYKPVYLYILAVPLGFAQGAVAPAANTMIFKRCSSRRRGSASAAYFAAIDIGIAIGSILFGFIADRFGFNIVFWGATIFIAAALAMYLLFLREKRKPAKI